MGLPVRPSSGGASGSLSEGSTLIHADGNCRSSNKNLDDLSTTTLLAEKVKHPF
jgi:hypothetical protein